MDSRHVRGTSEQPAERVTSRHGSGEDSSRTASSGANSLSESGHVRNSSNTADNEPRTSVEPSKISGRRSGGRRTDR